MVLSFLIFLLIKSGSSQATMGIDLGGNFIKVSVVTVSKPIETVVDRDSNRKTYSAIGFKDGYLVFAEAAKSLYNRHPDCVVRNPELLLGRKYDDSSIVTYRKNNPFLNLTKNEMTGGIIINFNKFNLTFTPVELFSILLNEIRSYTSAFSSYDISDSLISVSPTVDEAFSQAIKSSAKISDLNLMEITDNSRTSVGLEASRKKNTTIGSYNITGIGYNHIGASDFDTCICDYLITEFKLKHKIDIDLHKNHKTVSKFMDQAVYAKHILTSNKEAIVTVEEAYDYITFQTHLDRRLLDDRCGYVMAKIGDAVDRAFKSSKLKAENLSEVIIMGGGSLIPTVQSTIQLKTNQSPSRVLNTDESNAAGASILAAKIHKLFNVAEFKSPAYIYYPIEIEYDVKIVNNNNEEEIRHHKELLYPFLARQTAKKVLTISHVVDDFTIRVRNAQFPDHLNIEENNQRDIMDVHINGVKEAISNNSIHIPKHLSIHFCVDSYRLLNINKVEYLFENNQTKGLFNKMGQVVMNLFSRNPNNSNTEQPLETSKNNSANEEDIDKNITIENVKNETNPKYEDEHPKIENITIGVNFTIDILYLKPPSDEENSESLSKLSKLYYKERIKQEDTKARNDLENAIFETEKTITLGEIKHYFTEEEYNNMISVTQHTKEWFEIEGYSQNSTICKLRLSDIKSALSPGLTRIKDRQETERDTHNLLELINKTQQLVINTYERSELQQILNQTQGLQLLTMSYNTQKWLSDKLEEQKLLLPTDKPVLTSSQIRKKIKELDQSGESYYKTVQDTLNILANLMKTKTASNADLNKTKTNEISDNSTTEDNSKETAKNITQEDLKTEL
ncbi:hypothetical protein HZS_3933 [Henneguya salminicola]|nr:hypothetical protein HZS_3933 [Henneguya salminicola]